MTTNQLPEPGHTLTRANDIRTWVSDRQGTPAMTRERTSMGEWKARLCLSFAKTDRAPERAPTVNDGITPMSWSAWLAELERQQLALRINDSGDCELIPRTALN